jgi:hypothetical protein
MAYVVTELLSVNFVLNTLFCKKNMLSVALIFHLLSFPQ